jgi:hypothetical protein
MKAVAIFFRIFFFFTGAAIGALMLLLALASYGSTAELKNWEKTTAQVLSSDIRTSSMRGKKKYCPDIAVSYDFHGSRHQSELQIKDGPCSASSASIENLASRYSSGQQIEVFVNPKDPSEVKASDYSRSPLFYVFLVLGILSFLAAFAFLFAKANPAVKRDAPQAARPLP